MPTVYKKCFTCRWCRENKVLYHSITDAYGCLAASTNGLYDCWSSDNLRDCSTAIQGYLIREKLWFKRHKKVTDKTLSKRIAVWRIKLGVKLIEVQDD